MILLFYVLANFSRTELVKAFPFTSRSKLYKKLISK